MKRLLAGGFLATLILTQLVSCSDSKGYLRAIYMLVDTSGTYVREIQQANRIIKAIVVRMQPGDSFTLARIDSDSFSEKDIIINVTLDMRSSKANRQRIALIKDVNKFIKNVKSSRYTDITGGVLQALEYLGRSDAANKSIIIFSDMKEDLKKGQLRNVPMNFTDINVVSVNVTKLKSDSRDPRKYFKRLDKWKKRVKKTGGEWRVIDANNFRKVVSTVMN